MTEIFAPLWAIVTKSESGAEWLSSETHRMRKLAIAEYCHYWQRAVDITADYTIKDFRNNQKLRSKYWRRLKLLYNVRTQSVLVSWHPKD